MKFLSKSQLATTILMGAMAFPAASYAQDDFIIKLGGRLHVDYASLDSENMILMLVRQPCAALDLKGTVSLAKT